MHQQESVDDSQGSGVESMDVKGDWQQNNSEAPTGQPYRNRLIFLKTISYGFLSASGRNLSRYFQVAVRHIFRLHTVFEWPYDCCLCREPDTNGVMCSACTDLIAVNNRSCRFCAHPCAVLQQELPNAGVALPNSTSRGCAQVLPERAICESCNIEPPLYDSAVVPYLYRFPADQLVIQLKFYDSPGVARAMAQLMTDSLRLEIERTGLAPDFLVPVPLLPQRFRVRGFNQSMQLCLCLSANLKIPVHTTALGRIATSATAQAQSQTGLDRESRLSAGHLSFSAEDVSGLRLLLVDDVMTTGATFDNAAASLLDAGARSVSVCAFARTPR